MFDYGAPTGFRVAMAHPDRVTSIIYQNGNAYEEGLGDAWGQIRGYWASPTAEQRAMLRDSILTYEGTRWQYTHKEIQLDLFLDYASNVRLYPGFQEYFRRAAPPLLAIWGKYDPFFLPAGAQAFRKDLARAEVHLLATGHFALETHVVDIAAAMKEFLGASRAAASDSHTALS